MEFQPLVTRILTVCDPIKIILFAEKHTMATGKLKSLSLCVVIPDGTNCRLTRQALHLALSLEIPVNLTVYPKLDWEELCDDPDSYAAWINQKGQVLYESET